MRRLPGATPFELRPWPHAGWRWWGGLLLVLGTVLWPAAGAAAATPPAPPTGIAVEGQLGGHANAVAVQGDAAFLAVGPRVEVLETSDPANPRMLGQTALLPGDVQQVALGGAILVATYQSQAYPYVQVGLVTFDLGAPGAPRELGRVALTGDPLGLAVAGATAYVALRARQGPGGSVQAFDVDTPPGPRLLGAYAWSGDAPSGALAVSGSTVYLPVGDTVQLVSFADATQPHLLSTIALPPLQVAPSTARGVAVSGSVLVLTQGAAAEHGIRSGAVRSYDVGDPRHPAALGVLAAIGYPGGVQVAENGTAYVAASDGIRVFDLTSPAQPRSLAVLALNPPAGTLALSGDRLYALQFGATPLAIIDVANPAQPRVAGSVDALTTVLAVALAGSTLYVSNDLFALSVVDVSDPSRPTQLAQLDVPASVAALAASPPYVYAAGGPRTANGQIAPGSLEVIDASDPTRPAPAGELDLGGDPIALAAAGRHVYVAMAPTCAGPGSSGGGLAVVDVADPAHPVQTGMLPMQLGCQASLQVVTSGTLVYLTASLGKTGSVLDVVDVADPRHPALAAAVPEPTDPSLAISGHFLYLAMGSSLHVLDVADPARPRELAVVASPGPLAALALGGTTLLGSGADTTEVFDLADPARPQLVGTYGQLGAISLAADGDTLYVGSQLDGLWVLRALYAVQAARLAPPPLPRDDRYFPQTGYRVGDDAIWDYFTRRGGVATFGYPTSRVFTLEGFPVQFFQRQVMQRSPDGSVHLLNLLDPSLLPYTSFNGSIFPASDPTLAAQAPRVGSPDYASAAVRFVRQQAPDSWNGLPVHFQQGFLGSVSLRDAFAVGEGNPALLPLLDLEIWGPPTSPPAYDPSNHQFVYQRFQRGVMQYDAACTCTEGVLMADYLKAILTATNLPADLAREAQGGSLLGQYCPGATGWLCRPQDLPATDLTDAFMPG